MAAAWLEGLIYGIRTVLAGNTPLPDRPAISFSGAGVTVTDDVANNRTSVAIATTSSAPTGTGIPHVIAGAYAVAATKIVDGDVDPAAAIAATKLAPGTNGQWLTTAAGAAGWATPSWTDSNINAAAAIALSKLATTGSFTASTVTGTSTVSSALVTGTGNVRAGGGTFPTAGKLQFGNVAQVIVACRDIGNTSDVQIIEVQTGTDLLFGNSNWSNVKVNCWSGGNITFNPGNAERFRVDGTALTAEFGVALAGQLTTGITNQPLMLKPAVVAMAADANQTLTQPQYSCPAIEIVGGTTLTSARSIILPTVRGAFYIFRNASNGAQTLVPRTSAGAGPNVTNGTTSLIYCNGTDYVKIA